VTKPNTIVVDLDGTLCNSKHREHLAQAGQWDEFHSLLADDKPWGDVWQLIADLCGKYYIIGLTGRNEKYRLKTVQWLDKYEIELDNLLMRPDFDPRPDHELKPQLLAEAGVLPEEVLFVLEDRDKVVEAWRNWGYNCWQVRPGGY
jgi:FMN phosphatase YigB (HAD superfamily)